MCHLNQTIEGFCIAKLQSVQVYMTKHNQIFEGLNICHMSSCLSEQVHNAEPILAKLKCTQ